MSKHSGWWIALAGGIGLLFLYGLLSLLLLRYEAGDVYPAYSSLRRDPLGVKALYEGLGSVPAVAVNRNYAPLANLKDLRHTTLLYVGLSPDEEFDQESTTAIENLLLHGNRVIMTFAPVYQESSLLNWLEEEESAEEQPTEESDRDKDRAGETPPPRPTQTPTPVENRSWTLAEWWKLTFGYTALAQDDRRKYQPLQASRQQNDTLPATISWHSALYFEPEVQADWKVIYTANRQPVLIERTFGKGTLVLASDSYFLSNEAMRNERHADLLAYLIGPHTNVLFDETHLGVVASPGVAALFEKYRLWWFGAGLLTLAGLFVWKNAASFVPPPDSAVTEEERSGKDVLSGLVNLLRQHVPARDLVTVCFEEWQKSFSHNQKELGATIAEVRTIIETEKKRPARESNPVRCYQALCRVTSPRRHEDTKSSKQ